MSESSAGFDQYPVLSSAGDAVLLTLWLQISVDETHKMQVFQRSDDLGCVESSVFFGQALPRSGLQRTEELASHAIFHAEIKVIFGLEGVVEGDDEGMVGRCENLLLCHDALDLVALDHLLLAQHCVAKRFASDN